MGRTLQQTGMPVPSLVAHSIALSEEWHPIKNGDRKRDQIPYNSSYRAWWKCSKDPRHEWRSNVANRTIRGYGCPFCSGRKVISQDSIAGLFPDIAAEFHPDRNGDLRPDQLAPKSNKKVWWLCSTNRRHEWETTVMNRTLGSGCPECRRFANSLAGKSQDIASEWHPTRNGELSAADVPNRSDKSVWWQCRHDQSHEWQAMVKTRTNGRGNCPTCHPRQINPPPGRSIDSRWERRLSKTCPELVSFWDTTKNGETTPDDVTKGSSRVVWWKCPCHEGHEWSEAVKKISSRKNKCPLCESLQMHGAVTEEKSIGHLRPDLMDQWHPVLNEELDPMQIGTGSSRMVYWQCSRNTEHVWKTRVFQRKAGTGCPYCCGSAVNQETSLATLHPEIAATWHPAKNGTLTPSEMHRQSARSVWWLCPDDPTHEWKQSVQNRVNLDQCPECRKHTRQRELEEALARTVSENVESLKTFEDSLDSQTRLALLDTKDESLQQVLYRQVYAGIVTSMESYLSDTFINTVVGKKNLRDRFVRCTSEFRERKYNLDDLVGWEQNNQSIIKKHLLNQVFHNLPKMACMFRDVLKVTFPSDDELADLQKIVGVRHNIAHRNGRNKKGETVQLSMKDIDEALTLIRSFIEGIDAQIARQPWL
ncbi:zinc-ribbon domain-containing protein [Novipirellula caenicola]|uniref:Zinc-ribbon domain-containing protein n=1 Tax=Novipirellula caenicola TaxID=1536901 RepID=A0ABP9VJA3_9BACT